MLFRSKSGGNQPESLIWNLTAHGHLVPPDGTEDREREGARGAAGAPAKDATVNPPEEHVPRSACNTDDDAVLNRVMEESLALARAEEAAMNRVMEESLVSDPAKDATVNPLEEDVPRLACNTDEDAVLNRVMEESLALARVEEAVMNHVMEESLTSLRVQDMVRALCTSLNLEDHV